MSDSDFELDDSDEDETFDPTAADDDVDEEEYEEDEVVDEEEDEEDEEEYGRVGRKRSARDAPTRSSKRQRTVEFFDAPVTPGQRRSLFDKFKYRRLDKGSGSEGENQDDVLVFSSSDEEVVVEDKKDPEYHPMAVNSRWRRKGKRGAQKGYEEGYAEDEDGVLVFSSDEGAFQAEESDSEAEALGKGRRRTRGRRATRRQEGASSGGGQEAGGRAHTQPERSNTAPTIEVEVETDEEEADRESDEAKRGKGSVGGSKRMVDLSASEGDAGKSSTNGCAPGERKGAGVVLEVSEDETDASVGKSETNGEAAADEEGEEGEGGEDGEDVEDGEEEGGEEEKEAADVDTCTVDELIHECNLLSERLSERLRAHVNIKESEQDGAVSDVSLVSPLVSEQPASLKKTLKDYQLVGINWLYLLHQEGLSGILGDEMGLGKTVQTIAFLAVLNSRKPHLVIAPASTTHNWKREFQVWCPSMDVILYHGTAAERNQLQKRIRRSTPDVIIASYSVVNQQRDRLFLRKHLQYSYLVLDEAQSIKNVQSNRHRMLARFVSDYRLLLTGTPLQNNLAELWALLEFLMPEVFARFREHNPSMKEWSSIETSDERVRDMKALLAPFFLRRLKTNVVMGIPPKELKEHLCPMPSEQREVYTSIVTDSRAYLSTGADGQDKKMQRDSAKVLNNVFMQLRKAANHPLLLRSFYTDAKLKQVAQYALRVSNEFDGWSEEEVVLYLQDKSDFYLMQLMESLAVKGSACGVAPEELPSREGLTLEQAKVTECSGKTKKLQSLLGELRAEGHRVLLFSQMTKVLDILEWLLRAWDLSYVRFDGSTRIEDRQARIDQYNEDKSIFAFLLSTGAGGVGINLTSADTVIFYDNSFNPQVDRQAEDRCHRIGQERPVVIHRLVTAGSVDELILQRCKRKEALGNTMLEENTSEDVDDLPKSVQTMRALLSEVITGG